MEREQRHRVTNYAQEELNELALIAEDSWSSPEEYWNNSMNEIIVRMELVKLEILKIKSRTNPGL